MKIFYRALVFCFGFALLGGSGSPKAGAEIRSGGTPEPMAGWAEVEITPPLGIVLGGRGPTGVTGKSVLDPLFAQVLVLRDAKGAVMALVSADLIGFSHELSERLRLDLVHETGAAWDLTVLSASHTHSGPVMNHDLFAGNTPIPRNQQDYFDALQKKLVAAARQAMKALQPVRVEVFEGASQVALNRRGKNKSGAVAMLPNPGGPIADKVWIMRLAPAGGGAPALVYSYGCHPVIAYGYANAAISADWPGVARAALREKLGAAAHVQFVQGLAGNVRPRVLADLEQGRFRTLGPAGLQAAGKQMARDVLAALEGKGRTLVLDLAGAGDRPFMKRGDPPARETFEAALKSAAEPEKADAARYWLENYKTGEGFSKGDAWPTGLLRLGQDQWVFWLAGEPCVEWAPSVAKWLAPRQVVLWGYCQESLSYLPTDALLPEGGYEVLDSNRLRKSSPAPLAAGIDEAINKSLMKQLRAIEAK